MNLTFKQTSDETPKPQADPFHSDEETERLALAAADAIKRLIAERNALRSRLMSVESEATHLREHVTLIRNCYRRLANELVTQLQLIDRFDGEPQGTAGLVEFPRFLGK
jgi:hypothetical protein